MDGTGDSITLLRIQRGASARISLVCFKGLAVGAGHFQPVFKLFKANLLRVILHPVDLHEALPALFYFDDALPPVQGRFADVISVHGEDRAGSENYGTGKACKQDRQ